MVVNFILKYRFNTLDFNINYMFTCVSAHLSICPSCFVSLLKQVTQIPVTALVNSNIPPSGSNLCCKIQI